jgi:hypothetical protein
MALSPCGVLYRRYAVIVVVFVAGELAALVCSINNLSRVPPSSPPADPPPPFPFLCWSSTVATPDLVEGVVNLREFRVDRIFSLVDPVVGTFSYWPPLPATISISIASASPAQQSKILVTPTSTWWLHSWYSCDGVTSPWDPGTSYINCLRRRIQPHLKVVSALLTRRLLRPVFNRRCSARSPPRCTRLRRPCDTSPAAPSFQSPWIVLPCFFLDPGLMCNLVFLLGPKCNMSTVLSQ